MVAKFEVKVLKSKAYQQSQHFVLPRKVPINVAKPTGFS